MVRRWVLLVILFLMLVADKGATYEQWFAPFSWAFDLLFTPLPYKIRVIDHVLALCWFFAVRNAEGRGPRVAPMRNALILAVATTALWFAYGVVRGGDAWAASWQTYLMVSGILFAFSVAAVFRNVEDYALLAKIVLAAAAYRAAMCWLFHILYVRAGRIPRPEYITSHDDTVLWVVAMLIVLVQIINTTRFLTRLRSFVFLLFLTGAVFFNQRRLAWVSLAMGVAVVLVLLPPGKARRRVSRTTLVAAPLILLYVVIGWGRSGRLFSPLQSLASVTMDEDTSTKARNVENLGLIATANANNTLLGTGWGHPYIEVSNQYSIGRVFPLWQYIPHNSILGLLAYTGVFGFCGYWLVFPIGMFFNARMARGANTPLARQIGLIGAAQLLVCANQFYGDMGIYFIKSTYMMSLSYALALRLPILTGVWPPGSPRLSSKPAASVPARVGPA